MMQESEAERKKRLWTFFSVYYVLSAYVFIGKVTLWKSKNFYFKFWLIEITQSYELPLVDPQNRTHIL